MNCRIRYARLLNDSHGATLLDFLVGAIITLVLMAGVLQQYSSYAKHSYDHKLRIGTILQAQAILQNMGSEIRILGNGVPFDQPLFDIGEVSLTDPTVTYPILIDDTTASRISFRLNESGDVHILTQDFDTTGGATTVSLVDVSSLEVNDPIYISNSVVAEHDGLFGIVASVNSGANTIELAAGYVASPNAIFRIGSVLEETATVVYNSPEDGSGITRDSGFGPVLLGAGSSMELTYLDDLGAEIGLPLTETTLREGVRAVRIAVSLTNPKNLSDGSTFTANVEQVFGVRNLQLVY